MALNNTVRATLGAPSAQEMQLPDPNALPKTFGSNWNDPAFRKTHHKKQTLLGEFSGGKLPSGYTSKPPRKEEKLPNITAPTALALREKLNQSMGNTAPDPVTTSDSSKRYDLSDKVLRFFAYFVERCHESNVESLRVRKTTIHFFPNDDTLSVQEPRLANSGIQGGTLVKRAKVPLATLDAHRRCGAPKDGSRFPDMSEAPEEFISVDDLNVGRPLWIFGREYHLYACDGFTRRFLEALGVEVPGDLPSPDDHYLTEYRAKKIDGKVKTKSFETKDLSMTLESLGSNGRSAGHYPEDAIRVQRFIRDSGKVFRFYATYMDTESDPKGVLRNFELRYFVEDDSLSCVEHVPHNDGRGESTKTFLSRRRLPKSGSAGRLVDVTFANRINGQRDAFLGSGDSYYDAKDLDIGKTVNVFGRELKIYSVDDWTRDFYTEMLGIDLAPSVDINPATFGPKKFERKPQAPPPPTGFGTPEDSMASCGSLILKAPKKDLSRWHQHAGEMLRFKLRFHEPARVEDSMRSFVLTFYLDDGEIMVSEIPQRNTGFTGGKFLKKQRLRKHGAEGESPDCYYQLDDLQVGAVLNITGFRFELTEADQYTEKYLRFIETKGVAPEDVTNVTIDRLKALQKAFLEFVSVRYTTHTEAFRAFDRDGDGYVTANEMREVLSNNQVTKKEEEAMALLRLFDRSGDGFISYADFIHCLSNPATPSENNAGDVTQSAMRSKYRGDEKTRIIQRNKLLSQLRDRLEARRLNGFEMFRMLSTMPRAFRGKKAVEVAALTNGAKDVLVTPVQMRRGLPEVLGMEVTEPEMRVLLEYFFPNDDQDDIATHAEDLSTHNGVTMKEFHQRLTEMQRIGQLR